MKTYAIIDTNSGYVWGVVDSDSARQACYDVDVQAGGWHQEPGEYQEVSQSEIRSGRSLYDVRVAPDGFDVADGQDKDEIAAVEALQRVGLFCWTPEQ
jgi:hypothetical protein